MPTLTIHFRAKRDHFAGGVGYKVPRLTASHVTTDRDTYGILFVRGLHDADVTTARLRRLTGDYWRGVVFETDPGEWTITPRGNGFMADLTRTITR